MDWKCFFFVFLDLRLREDCGPEGWFFGIVGAGFGVGFGSHSVGDHDEKNIGFYSWKKMVFYINYKAD